MRQVFIGCIFALMLFACKKKELQAGSAVEIYLLKSFQLVSGKCQVDAATAVLQESPYVYNKDILAYFPSSYEYKLTDTAMMKLLTLEPRTPFAVTVDKEVIFYGINMPAILSSTCDHSITMTAGFFATDRVMMNLGYPGLQGTNMINDQRNNSKLIYTLTSQGKIK